MDLAAIRTTLEETYQGNRALIAGLRDTDLNERTRNPRWRVRQLAAHIAEDDAGTLYVGKLLARGKNAKAPNLVINLANWWTLRQYRKAQVNDLLGVLERTHRALMAWVESLPAEALLRGGEISQVGCLTLGAFLVQNAEHSQGHAADIRAALELRRETRGTTPPLSGTSETTH